MTGDRDIRLTKCGRCGSVYGHNGETVCLDCCQDERGGMCEDREAGGYDLVSYMKRISGRDPRMLNNELLRMGITETGDESEIL